MSQVSAAISPARSPALAESRAITRLRRGVRVWAKRFDDARLWGAEPEVLKQLRSYDALLKNNEGALKIAYVNVCKALVQLRQMKVPRTRHPHDQRTDSNWLVEQPIFRLWFCPRGN